MEPAIKTVIYPVKDLEGTKALFGALLGRLKAMEEAGGEVRTPARDVGGGKLVAIVMTSDGNPIGLSQSP
jgi:predicted enzyme related to lactoylglutathione lyase